MSIAEEPNQDPVWAEAWSWVMRAHEQPGLDDAARAALQQWLAANPHHRAVHADAQRLWFAAGFVPPAHDVDIPGDD